MGTAKSKESAPDKARIDLEQFRARVDKVKINGLDRTKDDYIQRACRSLKTVTNFKDVLTETNIVYENLQELGIFKNLHAFIDISRGKDASPNGYEVSFTGEELSRVTGTVGTEIGQNDGSLTMQLTSPNILGRGELMSINYSYSYIKSTELNVKLLKPFYHTSVGDYKPETSITLFKNTGVSPWSLFRSDNAGCLLDFSFLFPKLVSNTLQYELGYKEIFASTKLTPFFIREQCGPRLASIFRYTGAYDQRDNSIFPTEGLYIRTTAELIGDSLSRYGSVKSDSHVEVNMPLFAGMSLQWCGRFGKVFEDRKLIKSTPIDGLFFLGGPQSLRGFDQAGATPCEENVARGTKIYWATGLHLWSPLPFNRHFGEFGNLFRTHLFYNIGNCESFTLDNMRAAYGVGMAFKIGGRARIEINYCVPISKQKTDKARNAFQFGIGYEFL